MSAGNEEILDRDQAMIWKPLFAGGLLLALCACVSLPEGPSLPAYPGTKKTFDQFSADDAACRQYALASVGGKTAQQRATESPVASAAVGTAVGAAAGALAGGSEGAGVGAGAV